MIHLSLLKCLRDLLYTLCNTLRPCDAYIRRSLQWRHNDSDGVSNHQPHDCLLKRLFMRRSKKHQSSASLSFVRGIHRSPVNSPHKGPVTRKMFPFDDVIMQRNHHWFSNDLSPVWHQGETFSDELDPRKSQCNLNRMHKKSQHCIWKCHL